MKPLVVREFIKSIIDEKVKNLHPKIEEMIINKIIYNNLKGKSKILYFIRRELKLPKVGSDKKIYWERRGWNDDEIKERRIIKKMPSSPMKKENWLSKINSKTGKNYTIEEAEFKVKSFRKVNKEYWMEKGYNYKESLEKIKEFQKDNSNKFVTKILNSPEKYKNRTQTQIGYWIKSGFTKEESLIKLKERQTLTSLESFIKRYGEDDGLIRYNSFCDTQKYKSSIQFYIDKYGENYGTIKYKSIIEKRIVNFGRASKESFYFLLEIYKYLRKNGIEKGDIYWGIGHSTEWYTINSNGGLYFYDFTVPKINLVIEYHGIKFHPNENDININRDTWKSLYSGESFYEKLEYDKNKKDFIINKGYTYLEVFSDGNLIDMKQNIIKIIEQKLKNVEK